VLPLFVNVICSWFDAVCTTLRVMRFGLKAAVPALVVE
jgi:hypothetical protein